MVELLNIAFVPMSCRFRRLGYLLVTGRAANECALGHFVMSCHVMRKLIKFIMMAM